MDTKKLCIEVGKQVWSVLVDICTINDAGNLFDASSIATIAALKDAKLPKTVKENDVLKINYKEKTKESLPLVKLPLGITVCKIGDDLIVDPISVEEEMVDSRLTVASTDDGVLCALQKGEEGALTVDEIGAMLDLGIKTAQDLRKKL